MHDTAFLRSDEIPAAPPSNTTEGAWPATEHLDELLTP
jgi:hypothetical protein